MSRRPPLLTWVLGLVLALLGSTAIGCQPYYRDDELRALHAENSAQRNQLAAMGERLLTAGQAERATRYFKQAIEHSAAREAGLYLRLATAQHRSGQPAEACITARYALTRPEGSPGTYPQLRRLLVASYAETGFPHLALDYVEPATLAHAASLPELQPALAPLAEAERLSARAPSLALAKYAEWLSRYGEPDHAILRQARNRILRAAAPLTAGWAEQADLLLQKGQAPAAVRRYSLVYRYHSDEAFAAERSRFQRACAALQSPETLSPLATAELRSATFALEHRDLAGALLHTRRAVIAAPCWSAAQHNLAALLRSLAP